MVLKLFITTGFLFALGALIIAVSHRLSKLELSQRKADWIKYCVYLIIVAGLLLTAARGRWLTAVILGAIALGGSIELYRNLQNPSRVTVSLSFSIFIVLSLCLGHLLIGNADLWFPTFAMVFLLVAITDSFSQLWGKLLGTHKLCPDLSPGKTKEGLIGGFLSTALASLVLKFLLQNATFLQLIVLGLVIASSATAGDLLFSCIKRKLGIKDFSGILPGHGGILDRFDSLIVAAPVSYWTRLLLFN